MWCCLYDARGDDKLMVSNVIQMRTPGGKTYTPELLHRAYLQLLYLEQKELNKVKAETVLLSVWTKKDTVQAEFSSDSAYGVDLAHKRARITTF